MANNLPIKKWRSGSIDGAVWLNKHKKGNEEIEFKTATLRRCWKDRDQDLWRDEKLNLRKADIQRAILILQKIHEEMLLSDGGDEDE